MVRFFRDAGLPSRRSREAARQRRRSERASDLKLESLEPRLALASVAGILDTTPPVVRSVSPPAAGTYGTGSDLTFKVRFSEPVRVVGNQSDVFLPVEVGYAMREAQYVSGSGTRSLTFRLNVAANDRDTDGISLGRVNSAAVRDFDFAANRIQDRAGNPASNVIPAVNTSGIRVDATGPVVTSHSGFITKGRQVSLQVTFDGRVTVTGKPRVPVTIGGQTRSLAYVSGSGTSTLTFAIKVPRGASVANPVFRGVNGLPGEVILLPAGANLKDRFGNAVTPIGGDFGETYKDANGTRVVVIGTHFEKLTFGKLDSISQDDLNTILNDEQRGFRAGEVRAIKDGKADYWAGYVPPVFEPVKNEVELYRVAYRSTIPEQGNRPTVAYGLVAIPKGATGALPLVSYQHGTLMMKESAPSQAFSWDKTDDTTPVRYGLTQKQLYDSAYETRLNVAQFAGNGYAVIAADSFGLGNSVENDGLFVKGSAQQASLDMHAAAQKLFAGLNLRTDKLFLNGWSQGGVVTVALQEALEARGVKIDGVSTVAASVNREMGMNRLLFNPRPYSTTTPPDAPGLVTMLQLTAFSLEGYAGKPGAALELFGGNYDFARKFFMREFKTLPGFTFQEDVRGDMVPVMTMDGVTRSAEPSEFIVQRFGRNPSAYASTIFAGLMRDAGAGKTRLESTMKMYYGAADEGITEAVATSVAAWQRDTFGKTNIEAEPVADASHRDAVLSATYGQLRWFDDIRFDRPTTGVGVVNPVTGVPAAVENLTATPVGIGELRLDWSRSAGATLYDVYVNGQKKLASGTPVTFFDKLDPLTSYTFTVVPRNASGSGPETKVVFGAAEVDTTEGTTRRNAMTVGLDGSIWVARQDDDVFTVQQIAKNPDGTWSRRSRISVDKFPRALTTGLDGSIWVACKTTIIGPGSVQHIVQYPDGKWEVQGEAISVDNDPTALTTGLDGSIWVASSSYGTVQRIVKAQDGKWVVENPSTLVNDFPYSLTTGLDGSIWVGVAAKIGASNTGIVKQLVNVNGVWTLNSQLFVDVQPLVLSTAMDGSIWLMNHRFATVQRIVQDQFGQWGVEQFGDRPSIQVDTDPAGMTVGLDGSVWVGSHDYGTVQKIVNERGQWFVKGSAISIANGDVAALRTGLDGSIWVDTSTGVRQLWTNASPPTDLKVTPGPHEGMATLSWKPPVANGGTPVTSYTVTARQGATIRTFPNWDDTAYRVTGLDVSKGPVSFTVAANNFVGTSPVATLLMGQDGKPIDTTHLTTGITTDGTWVLGGGFDGVGNTYSWEALGSGVGVSNGKATFKFGLPNQPQAFVGAGQEIAVPQGAYGSVNLAGAAVYYGAQPNVAFTLNYTDGTTETWTQSFSDWAKPQQFDGETTLVTSPYRNQGDGTRDSRPVYLYGYSRAIQPGKTLKSITLPLNQNVRILDIKMGT